MHEVDVNGERELSRVFNACVFVEDCNFLMPLIAVDLKRSVIVK